MQGKNQNCSRNRNVGFTMVELAVVIAVLGVIATLGVPRFRDAVERSKATEAVTFFSSIRGAQESYHSRNGTYTDDLSRLDVAISSPKYFKVGGVKPGSTGNLESSWSLTLSRQGASAGYGAYTVSFTESGFDATNSSVVKLDKINPMK